MTSHFASWEKVQYIGDENWKTEVGGLKRQREEERGPGGARGVYGVKDQIDKRKKNKWHGVEPERCD